MHVYEVRPPKIIAALI